MRDCLREANRFLAANRTLVWWTLLAAMLSYGFAICNFSLSLDEEIHLSADQTFAWAAQGRWATTLIKLLFGTRLPLPFYQPAVAVLVLVGSAVAWCFAFDHVTGKRLERSPWLILFAVVYLTMPCNSYYLSFNTYNSEISVALLLSPLFSLAAFSWAFDRRGGWSLVCAILFGTASIAIYQSFLIVDAVGIIAIVLLHTISLPSGAKISIVEATRRLVYCAVPLAASYLCYRLVSAFIDSGKGYVDTFFNWGRLGNAFIAHTLWAYVLAFFRGEGFIGGRIVWPLAVAAVIVGAFLLWDTARRRGGMAPLLLFFVLLSSPFLLSIGLGTPMPNRTQQVLPLAYGLIVLIATLRLGWERRGHAAAVFATLLVITWNGEANTRLFLSKYLTFHRDEEIAHQVAERLYANGWDGRRAPLVVVGTFSYAPQRYLYQSETIGASFFGWDNGNRAPIFMSILGYALAYPTPVQRREASSIAEAMPTWPRLGSVAFTNGLAIVKLAPAAAD